MSKRNRRRSLKYRAAAKEKNEETNIDFFSGAMIVAKGILAIADIFANRTTPVTDDDDLPITEDADFEIISPQQKQLENGNNNSAS